MNQRGSIQLTPAEAARFLEESRTLVLASNGRDGYPHLVAMWYVVKDGDLWMTTYGKSQKAVNIRRDPRVTGMIESGGAYNELRGLMIRGTAQLIEETAVVADVLRMVGRKMSGVAVTPEQNAALEKQAGKRVVIRLHPEKTASWDHAKMASQR